MLHVLLIIVILFITPMSVVATPIKPADGERLLVLRATGSTAEYEPAAQSGVYDSIIEYLTDRGYRVVDRAAAEQASIQIAATHEIDPVLNKAADYGLKFLAEYTIHFKTSTIVKEPVKGIGALVRVKAKIVDNTGARIVTAKSADASSTGFTPDDAVEKASRSAGKKLVVQLTKGLELYVKQNGTEGRTITMVFEGQQNKVDKLGVFLEKNSAVAAIKELESGGGKSTFEIISKVRRDQLERELLNIASQQKIVLQKIRSEGCRSTWKIK